MMSAIVVYLPRKIYLVLLSFLCNALDVVDRSRHAHSYLRLHPTAPVTLRTNPFESMKLQKTETKKGEFLLPLSSALVMCTGGTDGARLQNERERER